MNTLYTVVPSFGEWLEEEGESQVSTIVIDYWNAL